MDYYSMKRKELQALCKQHNIPANSANSVLAHKLSQLLDEKQKPTTRQRTCLKSPIEAPVEGEPAVSKREPKKVRFSPNNDLLEYERRSGKKHKDVLTDDGTQGPVRLTRSRVGKDGVISNNEKKQSKKAEKDVEKVSDVGEEPGGHLGKVTRSKAHTLSKGGDVQFDETTKQSKTEMKDVEKTNESAQGTVVSRVRVTRSKAQSMTKDGIGSNVNPQLKKSSVRRVAKDAHNVEPSTESTDIPVRVTRTRGQILKEDIGNTVTNPQGEKKRTRKEMKSTDLRINSSNVAPDDNQELPRRKSSRTRGVETVDEDEAEKLGCGKQKKRSKESVAEVGEIPRHADKAPRQSRNVAKVEESVVLNQIVSEVEIVTDKKVTRSKHQRESKLVQQPEDPSDHEEKKVVNRRKSVTQKAQGPKSRKRGGTPVVEDQTVETKYISPADESPRHSAPGSSKSEGKSVAEKQVESSLKTPASGKNNQLAVQNAFLEVNKESSSKKRAKLSGTNQRYSQDHSEKSSVKGTPVSKLRNFELDEEVAEIESTPVIESHRRVTRSAIRTGEKEPSQSAIKEQPTGDAQFSSRKGARFRHDPAINTAPGRVTRSGIKHVGNAAIIFSDKVDKRKQLSRSAHRKQPFDDTQIPLPEGAEVGLSPDVDSIGVQSEIFKASESVKLPTIVPEENMVMENLSPVSGENASGVESHTISNMKRIHVTMAEKPDVYETISNAVSDGSHVQNETQEVSVKSAILREAEVQVTFNSEKPMVDENEMDLTKLGSTSKGLQVDLMAEEPAISVDKTVVMEENEAGSSAVCHVSVDQSDVKGKSEELKDQVELSIVENVMQSVEDYGNYAPLAMESKQDDLTCKDSLQNDSVDKHEVADNGEGDDEEESVGVQNPLMNEPVSEDRGGNYAPLAKESKKDDLTCNDSVQNDSVDKHEVADNGEGDDEEESVGAQNPLMNEPVSEDRGGNYAPLANNGEGDDEEESVGVQNSLMNEPVSEDRGGNYTPLAKEQDDLTCKDSLQNDSVDKHEVADNGEGDDEEESVCVQNPLMNEPASEDRGGNYAPLANNVEGDDEEEGINVQNPLRNEPVSEDRGGNYAPTAKESKQYDLTCKDSLQNDSVDKHEVDDIGEGADEEESVDVQNPLMNEPVSEDNGVADRVDALKIDESDNKEDIITTGQSVNEHGELLSTGKSVNNCLGMDSSGVEFEVVPSTDNDVHKVPILGECVGKEDIVYTAQSVAEHGELSTGSDVHEIPISGGSDDKEEIVSAGESVAEHGEMSTGVQEIPNLGESSNKEDMITAAQKVAKHGELSSGQDFFYGFSLDRSDDAADDVVDAGKDPTNKLEFEVVPSTGNDVYEVPILGKSDGEDEGANITKEGEIDSMPLTDGNMLEDPVMSDSDGGDGDANTLDCDTDSLPLTSGNMIEDSVLSGSDSKAESNPKPLTDHVVSDTSFFGKLEPTLELSPADAIIESPLSNNDIYDDGGNNVPKELEAALEPANAPVSINDASGDFENDLLTSNDSCALDDHNIGGENSEPPANENTNVVTDVSIRSCDQEPEQVFNVAADEVPCDTVGISASVGPFDSSTNIEAPHTHAIATITVEESILDINKETVSNILGDNYTDTKNDGGKERESFPSDIIKEETSEKTEMTTGNDQEEHTVAPVDRGVDGGEFMEDCSNHGVEELDSELGGIVDSDENPTREENPPTETKERKDSDSSTFLNEDDIDKQGSPVEWGDFSFGIDEFHNSVAENESDDELDKSRKVSEFQTSVGASSSSEETSEVAADMINSVKNLEMATRNVAHEKSSQEVDMLKENVNTDVTNELFNWSDSSLKSLFKTPAVTQVSHDEDGQEGVGFSSQDYSSLNHLFKTPATTRIGDVGYAQDDTVNISEEDHCSSLAPASASISHVKEEDENAGRFIFQDDRCNRDVAKNGTPTHKFDDQWESLVGFDGNATRHLSENVTYGSIEDYSHKFSGDKVDHSIDDGSGKDKHFELKVDQVDQTKQFDLSSEVAGTSHDHASGLKDNSVYSVEDEKKEETPALFDDLDFDKGM